MRGNRAENVSTVPWQVCTGTVPPDYCFFVTYNDGTTGIVEMSLLIPGERAGIFEALNKISNYSTRFTSS